MLQICMSKDINYTKYSITFATDILIIYHGSSFIAAHLAQIMLPHCALYILVNYIYTAINE